MLSPPNQFNPGEACEIRRSDWMKTKLFELQRFTGRCSVQSGVARLQPRGVVHTSRTDLDGRPLFPGTDQTSIQNPTRFLSWWPFSNTFSLQNLRERPARSTFLHTDDQKKPCERSIWAPKPWMCTKTHHFPHPPPGLLAVVDMSIKPLGIFLKSKPISTTLAMTRRHLGFDPHSGSTEASGHFVLCANGKPHPLMVKASSAFFKPSNLRCDYKTAGLSAAIRSGASVH